MDKRKRNIIIIGATVGVLGLTAYFLYGYFKKNRQKKIVAFKKPQFKDQIDPERLKEKLKQSKQ